MGNAPRQAVSLPVISASMDGGARCTLSPRIDLGNVRGQRREWGVGQMVEENILRWRTGGRGHLDRRGRIGRGYGCYPRTVAAELRLGRELRTWAWRGSRA